MIIRPSNYFIFFFISSVSISGHSTQELLCTMCCFWWDLTEITCKEWFAAQGTRATEVGWEFFALILSLPPFPLGIQGFTAALSEHSHRELISLISVSNVILTNFIPQFLLCSSPSLILERHVQPHSLWDNSEIAVKRAGLLPCGSEFYYISGQWAWIRHSTLSQTVGCWHQGFGFGRGGLFLLVKKTDKCCENLSGFNVLIALLKIIILWGYRSKYPGSLLRVRRLMT